MVATFASHVHRMQQVVDLSLKFGRKVALAGRSLVQNVKIARDLGKLDAPDEALVDIGDVGALAPSQLTLLAAGSQGEPRSAFRASRRTTIRRSPRAQGTSSCCPRA